MDEITHPRLNFNGGLIKQPLKLRHGRVIISQMFNDDIIIYPCPKTDAGLINLLLV